MKCTKLMHVPLATPKVGFKRMKTIARYQEPSKSQFKPEQKTPAPLECRNDWDEVVLVSKNPDEVKEEIQRLKMENERLKHQIEELGVNVANDEITARVELQEQQFFDKLDASESRLPAKTLSLSQQTEIFKETKQVGKTLSRTRDLIKDALEQVSSGQSQQRAKEAIQSMNIIFVSAEVAPWSKTGGLGDVVGSLPPSMAKRGHRVLVISPRYLNGSNGDIWEDCTQLGQRLDINMGECGWQNVGFFYKQSDNVDWLFVDHPCFHREGNPYGDSHGAFGDNLFRFSLLSLAACEASLQLNIPLHRESETAQPFGESVMFVANDWHAAMVPIYLSLKFRPAGVFKDARSVVAVHNLLHQGIYEQQWIQRLGLGVQQGINLMHYDLEPQDNQQHAYINVLKGGLSCADSVVTVSQRYAWEITHSEFGCKMDQILQNRGSTLFGILNGIDSQSWDPQIDPHIAKQFSSTDDVQQKLACKVALQKELNLPSNSDVPLLGFVGRLDRQKGPDIILDALPYLVHMGCQIVMLGSGWQEYEALMLHREQEFPESFRAIVGFSVPLAHRIVAGCDALLIPSRFEPCGLNQMHAMRYGTLPIAHATGGLLDTVQSVSPFAKSISSEQDVAGTGWLYSSNQRSALVDAVERAIQIYNERPEMWQSFRKQAMSRDFGWAQPAMQYEQVFMQTFENGPFFVS
eukprot:TRINITY_DN5125_c0_g2_i2.p1 TRINITY_DN5125_c0_g2~~TRINITY_DN5125_c0_g2_i2.p1  ORF type:complete len:766 (+),score=60.47 TRINITY_DN5125_c0_g2_i2:228-2300(+)